MKANTLSTSTSLKKYEGTELIAYFGLESSRANMHDEDTDSSLPTGGKRKVMVEARRQAKPTNLMSVPIRRG